MISDPVFEKQVKFLSSYLNRTDLVEICINEPGSLWLETINGTWEHKTDKKITIEAMRLLTVTMATWRGQNFDHKTPHYSGKMPIFGYRVQVNMFNHVESGISVSIRMGKATIYPLSGYVDTETEKKLINFVKNGKTILICADTGGGKTTFLNTLSSYIPMDQRIITIEDTRELIISQPNKVHFLKSKSGTDVAQLEYKDFIDFCTRSNPSRILMGEIDTNNAMLFLNLANSGHGGSISTMHSDSEDGAFAKLCLNAQIGGVQGVSSDALMGYAKSAIDVLIFLDKKIVNEKRIFSATVVEV